MAIRGDKKRICALANQGGERRVGVASLVTLRTCNRSPSAFAAFRRSLIWGSAFASALGLMNTPTVAALGTSRCRTSSC